MKTTNNIQIFKSEVFGQVRTMTNAEGETFFVGRDVATALGYSNTRDALNRHVDKEDRDGVVIHDSIGRKGRGWSRVGDSDYWILVQWMDLWKGPTMPRRSRSLPLRRSSVL